MGWYRNKKENTHVFPCREKEKPDWLFFFLIKNQLNLIKTNLLFSLNI